ncbi:DapH/DapD/GlmU-related protein [Halorubrum ezzemoulense]|jgi:maltose O-acetyltransferase|uniref:Acetyltransferase n=2 Tax=Halorubrum ezzemoulense TaxID=337243 RepID=A0A238WB84_HALEZ|nr:MULTISPECIES: maltose acetyltransferase domain-containing protein [Halorubrum]MDB2223100.1 DapH/DapD/GlmU-related protein [Halorubrum ezzemoulense]MDB2243651.1 DapH/DapD/GlmU-related protein [Halorubrum ezzemoulense]MDB2251717.1 DapH/DapD/GlmU-related protein [Halorubrum ezzemoulense]MDB2264693.1 DapH/DapD/GlmU-related protein [Halorubrum ezzemoulense]MDB2277387.1 DapH/DapD/GlmU-related protein [Halorubrum ezzemoulense]
MGREKERMLAGEAYDPSAPELVADRKRARDRCRRYNATAPTEADRRDRLLSELFGAVEGDATVVPPFRCDYGYNVGVGDGFFANYGCVVLDVAPVAFGKNCLLGPGVHVYTATHPIDPAERAAGREFGDPVTVGDDAWIGGRAVITPGVEIGDGAVVAAGAVVVDDVPARTVVGGNPAEEIREIDDE